MEVGFTPLQPFSPKTCNESYCHKVCEVLSYRLDNYYTMQNIFSIFYVLHFFHHPSVTLSKFKLQRIEQYLKHKRPRNFRSHLSGEIIRICVCYLSPANSTRAVNINGFFDTLLGHLYEY